MSPQNKMENKQWISFLASQAFLVRGSQPSQPFLVDFPQSSKDNLKKYVLGLPRLNSQQRLNLYDNIKEQAGKLFISNKTKQVSTQAAIQATTTWYAMGGAPLTGLQLLQLQDSAGAAALRKAFGLP